MQSRLRVPFGLRSDATESEGSWSGSQFSSLPTDSDVDSLKDFDCDADLPGFDAEPPASPQLPSRAPNIPAKESWSEIDEKARAQEAQQPRTTSPATLRQTDGARSDSNSLSRAEKSDCWRSKSYSKRRQDRKRPDRRRLRVDPPLKGAVVRPYTLPSGPITVLRRPQARDVDDADKISETHDKPTGSEIDFKGHETKENEHGNGVSVGGKAKVVNTRFGQGFLVDNPPVCKTTSTAEETSNKSKEVKVAHNAATMAMAGLSMKSKEDKHHSYDTSISAESYDRSLGGRYRQRPSRCKDRWTNASYNDRFSRNKRPNVFIGRRPKCETRLGE